jgi:hypothetical protein
MSPEKAMSPDEVLSSKRVGDEIAEAFQDKVDWWWRAGKAMSEQDLSPAEARQAVEVSGRVLKKSDRTLYRIRLTYKMAQEAGLTERDVRGCSRKFVGQCARLLRQGVLSEPEARAIIQYRSSHIGSGTRIYEKLKRRPNELADQVAGDE